MLHCHEWIKYIVNISHQALRTPMALKYDCTAQTTWKLAVNSLLTVLQIGLPVALNNPGE